MPRSRAAALASTTRVAGAALVTTAIGRSRSEGSARSAAAAAKASTQTHATRLTCLALRRPGLCRPPLPLIERLGRRRGRTLVADSLKARPHARQPRRGAPRAGPCQRVAPRAHGRRRAGARDTPRAAQQQRHPRAPSGLAQAKGSAERHARRRLAGVEGHERKARTARQQIGRGQRGGATSAAAHPEQPREHDTRPRGGRRIERAVGVHERRRSARRGDVAQARGHQTRAPRRQLADDFSDRPHAYPRSPRHDPEAKHELSIPQAHRCRVRGGVDPLHPGCAAPRSDVSRGHSMASRLHPFSSENKRGRGLMAKQIGYAVVGAGPLVERALLPAFARAGGETRLAAIVSADRTRADALAQEHRATGYQYDEFRQCLQREDVQAVYLALPNSLHCDYAVEAADAGAHVVCERPMAVMADECRRMLRTCQTNRVKLMVAYHVEAEPAYKKLLELVRGGAIGAPKTFSSDSTIRVQDPDDPRLQRRLGGGTVYDLGVPEIFVARTVFDAEPAQVMAMTARMTRRYGGDVDESTVALIRFPDDRLAHPPPSFRQEATSVLTVFGDEGSIRLTGAYEAHRSSALEVVRGGRREEITFEPSDPFAVELANFSNSILRDVAPDPSGIEGLTDVRIVEAIYRSARDGRPVTLPRVARLEASPAEHDLRKPVANRRQAS